ncbi:MAG: hypothetical protein Q9164_007338, partial [Protoblastenia rupestris]
MYNPFGQIAPNSTADWVSEPNNRGSWTILTSSLITIGLCAWTALHLNVPEQGCKHQWLRKTKWFILGLAAPEVVAYIAWRQRLEAARLVKDIGTAVHRKEPRLCWIRWAAPWLRFASKHTSSHEKDPEPPASPGPAGTNVEWTPTHGFYAAMGGFAMSARDAKDQFLPEGYSRVALTTDGVRFLHEHAPELLPCISKEEIEDKSKADGLKKFLVCAQGLWFCVSCISRMAKGLPISLLELNAMAHALCALLIYIFWWSKPLDVGEPTVLKGEGVEELLAYFWMGSRISVDAEGWLGHDVIGRLRDEFDALWLFENPNVDDLIFPRKQTINQQQQK